MFGFFLLVFSSLIAMINPLSAIPVYISVMAEYSPERQRAMLKRAIVFTILMLTVFGMAGSVIMRIFGVTTTAFRLAGGLIFLATGWEMLHGQRGSKTTMDEERDIVTHHPDDVSIIPLAIPTLAGPGAITTVITLSTNATTLTAHLTIYGCIILVSLLSWATLSLAPRVVHRMGQTGLNVMTRIFGLLVIVVGMQFFSDGVVEIAHRIVLRT